MDWSLGSPLLDLSGITGLVALRILRHEARRSTRVLGALAVASLIWS